MKSSAHFYPEVVQWLRSDAALKSTPDIVQTTNAHDVSRSKVWAVDAVTLKPVSPEAIESTVREVVNQESGTRGP